MMKRSTQDGEREVSKEIIVTIKIGQTLTFAYSLTQMRKRWREENIPLGIDLSLFELRYSFSSLIQPPISSGREASSLFSIHIFFTDSQFPTCVGVKKRMMKKVRTSFGKDVSLFPLSVTAVSCLNAPTSGGREDKERFLSSNTLRLVHFLSF